MKHHKSESEKSRQRARSKQNKIRKIKKDILSGRHNQSHAKKLEDRLDFYKN